MFGSVIAPGANAIVQIVPVRRRRADGDRLQAGVANAPLEAAPDTNGNVWFTGSGGTGGARSADAERRAGAEQRPQPPTAAATAGDRPRPRPPPVGRPNDAPPTLRRRPVAASVTDPPCTADAISANQICVGPP